MVVRASESESATREFEKEGLKLMKRQTWSNEDPDNQCFDANEREKRRQSEFYCRASFRGEQFNLISNFKDWWHNVAALKKGKRNDEDLKFHAVSGYHRNRRPSTCGLEAVTAFRRVNANCKMGMEFFGDGECIAECDLEKDEDNLYDRVGNFWATITFLASGRYVQYITGTNPTPDRLQKAKRVGYKVGDTKRIPLQIRTAIAPFCPEGMATKEDHAKSFQGQVMCNGGVYVFQRKPKKNEEDPDHIVVAIDPEFRVELRPDTEINRDIWNRKQERKKLHESKRSMHVEGKSIDDWTDGELENKDDDSTLIRVKWRNAKKLGNILMKEQNKEMEAGAGNVFGFWADLQVQTPFVVHRKKLTDLTNHQRQQYRILPFKMPTNDKRPLMYMKWPGGGQIASFQFVNGLIVSKKDEFHPEQTLDQLRAMSNEGTEFVPTYNYIDNFVYAPKLQNGPFIETHPFPHVFVPQIGIGKGRVIVGTVADKDGEYSNSDMEEFARAMEKQTDEADKKCQDAIGTALEKYECKGEWIGYIKLLEIEVDYGYGLLVGANVMHSDSPTLGPMIAVVDARETHANPARIYQTKGGVPLEDANSFETGELVRIYDLGEGNTVGKKLWSRLRQKTFRWMLRADEERQGCSNAISEMVGGDTAWNTRKASTGRKGKEMDKDIEELVIKGKQTQIWNKLREFMKEKNAEKQAEVLQRTAEGNSMKIM